MQVGKFNIDTLVGVALSASLMCVSSLISLPGAVAFTLQTLALYFNLFFLGGRLTILSTALYIVIGAVGVPVFAGFGGGVGRLFDATGGFIVGFLFAALVYTVFEKNAKKNRIYLALSTAFSLLTLYAFGSGWYFYLYTAHTLSEYGAVLSVTVLPYILPDIIKIFLAYFLSKRVKRAIKNK